MNIMSEKSNFSLGIRAAILSSVAIPTFATASVEATGTARSSLSSQAGEMLQAVDPAQASAPERAAAGAQQNVSVSNDIVVTGSRIPQPNLTSVSPVMAVGSAEITRQGTTRIEDVLNNLPQVTSAQTSGVIGAFSSGTATVNLRNLGPSRTLVLIDGRRLGPGDPQSVRSYAADLNFIPSSLVERVELLTGGASATYGSDALAGVVNFMMKKNFSGIRVDVTGGGNLASNNDSYLHQLAGSFGVPNPTGTKLDGGNLDTTVSAGTNSSDGRGNVTAYVGYRTQSAVVQTSRDLGACLLGETATGFTCTGSSSSAASHVIASNPQTGAIIGPANGYIVGANNTFVPYTAANGFNTTPYRQYLRPDTRITAGMFAHFDIDPKLSLYAQVMFMNDRTSWSSAPSGVFGQTFTIPCNSPLLSASQASTLCTAAGLTSANSVTTQILRRNVEGGERKTQIEHTSFRIMAGARGALGKGWSYDVYAQYFRARYDQRYTGEFSLARISNALKVVQNTDGSLRCANGGADGCVPYQAFNTAGPSAASIAYLTVPAFQSGETVEKVVNASLAGDLGEYGIKSPFADTGVGVALGVEYRSEGLSLRNDQEYLSGDLAGASAYPNVTGSSNVKEIFGEARIPVAKDVRFLKLLSFDAGYRYSSYSLGFKTNTYKFGGEWSPMEGVRLRSSFNHAIRAPNLLELYTPQYIGQGLGSSIDPCANSAQTGAPTATFAQCALTGVTQSQYGNIAAAPGASYNGQLGGNPNLQPETSNTLSYGIVLNPKMIPHLAFSVDLFDIRIKNVIGQVGANNILTACLNNGQLCNLVHRSSLGSLWIGNEGYVSNTNVNSGLLHSRGIDFEGRYSFPLFGSGGKDLGQIALNFQGTYLAHYDFQPVPGGQQYDCAGYYGPRCANTLSKWRHQFRVTYSAPFPLQVSALWRYLSPVTVETLSGNPALAGTSYPADSHIKAYSYFDLTASYKLRKGLEIRIGSNNLFDRKPPIIGASVGGSNTAYNANTWSTTYDSLGRTVFAGVSATF